MNPSTFSKGEPICRFVPISRGLAASLQPVLAPIADKPDLEKQYLTLKNSRLETLEQIKHEPGIAPKTWQRDYYKGQTRNGKKFPDHETGLDLKESE